MRFRCFPLAGAALALCAPLSAQDPHLDRRPPGRVELATPEVVAPLEIVKGRPVVQVRIGGNGPFPFIVDTGAGGTVIEAGLARELSLPIEGEARIGDPIQPHAIAAKSARIDLLKIGGAAFERSRATVIDQPGFADHLGARGVLGMPLFSDLLLTLDYGRKEIRIGRGSLPAADEKQVLSYREGPMGTIRVPLGVGPLSIDADLDTGSPAGLSLPDGDMDRLPLQGKPVEVGRARTLSSEFVVHAATLQGTLSLGEFRIENPTLRFNALPGANIGSELIGRFVVTLDQKNHRVRFREASGGAPSETPAAPAPAPARSGR